MTVSADGEVLHAERRRAARLRRAVREPRAAVRYVVAILRGHWCRLYYALRGRRFRAGRRLRVIGRLSVRGPGEVILGDDVVVMDRVNAWTYSREARILIGDNVLMGGTRFACVQEIRIGRDSILADARIMDTDFHSIRADRRSATAPVRVAPVEVGTNVWVAASAALLPGTIIGENSVVGCAAVCMRDYPANKVIIGNPAKVAMPVPTANGPTETPTGGPHESA